MKEVTTACSFMIDDDEVIHKIIDTILGDLEEREEIGSEILVDQFEYPRFEIVLHFKGIKAKSQQEADRMVSEAISEAGGREE